jgi:hypothetical protein
MTHKKRAPPAPCPRGGKRKRKKERILKEMRKKERILKEF